MATNQVPVRPASRNKIYDVIDGERDYQDAKYPKPQTVEEYLALISTYNRGGSADNLRKVAALAVRALELYVEVVPRAYHVPASANITGTLHVRDLSDSFAPSDQYQSPRAG